ncbi:RHS repeat-associated core domain-containing protein [Vitiosangium sp. GDMCC 1.1324]|uniref:RHS repeat-associated core domain-containing protein n=1 Tax=Vitiosangium sp. (strain GDMCC 1.1324) TaxID=2138576 RepID=UPI000D392C65|nr:RHS repeat-associated core domain-containing protein [Vitiosangium sp. GDMCC 1.1324]PTL76457.1 hypothetical protein DAT35_49930 [Vitiosangium sp. GDMCC 1.1324]
MKTLSALFLCLGTLSLLPSTATAQQLCSPFDAIPDSNVTAGGRLADVAACCDGEATDEGCGPCRCAECGDEAEERNIGRPVDMLSGFAWLERSDADIPSPSGPGILFERTYSTHWAQSNGGRNEIGRLGPGWTDTYGARLVLDGTPTPAQVTYRKADTGTENFTRQPDGSYAGRMPGRRLFYDSLTQRWVLEKFDASSEVFDPSGRLTHLRAADGGEVHLVYTSEDAACPAEATRPAGSLCRVDFLFGHKMWLRYHTTSYAGSPRLASVSWDAAGTLVLVQYDYDATGYLTKATQADNRQETYTYGFTHFFPRHPGQSVKLLTLAQDGDGALVESFAYQQLRLAPSRVRKHETPEGRYTFRDGLYSSSSLERYTEVNSSQENLRITWEGGKLKTVCMPQYGSCDVTRMKEMMVPATGILAPTCERDYDGYYTRYLRDALGRQTSILPGLSDCNNPTPEEARHELVRGYVANSNRLAYTSRASVDASAPSGFATYTVYDYTSPASAVDPNCGTAACQTPTAYNTPASALTPLMHQRVRVGRTVVDLNGTWATRAEVVRYTYGPDGLLSSVDGPRTDVDDTTTFEYYDVQGPTNEAGRLKKVRQGSQVVAEYSDYNDRGQPRRVVDGYGQVVLYTYDAVGRSLTVWMPGDAQSTRYTYSNGGRLLEVKLPRGDRLLYSYNTLGRLVSVGQTHVASGTPAVFDEEVRYEWGDTDDDFGRLLRESYLREGNLVRTTTYGYDNQGRRAEIRHLRVETEEQVHAAVRLTTFDEHGSIVSTTSGLDTHDDGRNLGSPTKYLYDNLQRLSRVEGPSATPQNFLYDAHDNLTEVYEVYDPQYTTTYPRLIYRYDDFGNLVEVTSTTLGTRRYVYDVAGNRVQERLPTGQVLTYTYDGSGRLTGLTSPDGSETYTYDTDAATAVLDCATGNALGASNGIGQLTAVTETSGTTWFGYTHGGRLRFEARRAPGATCARTVRWEYDDNGHLSAMRYPSGATVRFEYPAAGQPHMHVPSAVKLVVGTTTVPLATALTWEAGAFVGYSAGNSLTWRLTRWLDGSPREWTVTQGETGPVIRRRTFGEEVNGTLEPRLDGRGNPRRIEENEPAWTKEFEYNEGTGSLVLSTHEGLRKQFGYGTNGDRTSTMTATAPPSETIVSFENYNINSTTFRLTDATEFNMSSGTSSSQKYASYTAGGQVTQKNTDGRLQALCYDAKEQVAAVVGPGGQYSRQDFNFRHQRVREVWPLNGLVTDYWVDDNGFLLMEAGAASLTAQYPRPVSEYVYVAGQPVAMLLSMEAQDGTTTYQGVRYLFGGHLGELLMEADDEGHVVRGYDYSPFGERKTQAAPRRTLELTLTRTGSTTAQVELPGASAGRLHFESFSLASCDSVVVRDADGNLLKRLGSAQPTSFWTETLPAQHLQVQLEQGTCAGSSSFVLKEAEPTWGGAHDSSMTGYASAHPYPAAGNRVSLSLPPNTHLKIQMEVASCDALEVRRSGTGDVLWTRPAGNSTLSTEWTPALSGDVEVGIWGQGCNLTEQKWGFSVSGLHTHSAPGIPANLNLPGQRPLTASASTRRGAFNEPEADLFENGYRTYDARLGRYLQPEPLLMDPEFVGWSAAQEKGIPFYGYAANNPLFFTDADGLAIVGYEQLDDGSKAAIDEFRKTSCGEKMWNRMRDSGTLFILKNTTRLSPGVAAKTAPLEGLKLGPPTVVISIQPGNMSSASEAYVVRKPTLLHMVSHEFVHAVKYSVGNGDSWAHMKPNNRKAFRRLEEWTDKKATCASKCEIMDSAFPEKWYPSYPYP